MSCCVSVVRPHLLLSGIQCTDVSHCVCCSPVHGRAGSSQCWSVVSSGAVNMSTCVCVRVPVLTSPGSGLAGCIYDSFTFNFLRNCRTAF